MADMQESEILKANIAALYSRAAPLYGQVGPGRFAYVGRGLVERLGIGEGAQVLDVAAGRGANLFPAAEKVGPRGQVTGIDLSEGMVRETADEIARRDVRNAAVMQMDAEQLTFDDASFDYILCGFAIFFFPHLGRALAGFHRVLRPGGKLGISVANDRDPLSQWYGKHVTEYATHYHIPMRVGRGSLDFDEIPAHLVRAGFTKTELMREQADLPYASAQEWWDEKWTHGTRYALEHMTPEVLAQFKDEVFVRLAEEQQAGGIREVLQIQYHIATK
ncbi:MAG TPA: class I SAM-dependent methyltransferase [Chthonomonadales bacterium]|nr:class I SAM-dependent methyltransferase [Chthonomonadales bacterium]